DLELDPEDNDYIEIPLVSNSEGYSVLCVEDCEIYQEAKKTGDFDISKKKKRRTLKDKLTPTLYEHRKFLPKNVNFIDLDAPDPVPVPEPPTHAKRARANDDEQEHTHQKKSRVDNDIPGPSKPKKKMRELTAVAGPSKPKNAGPSKQFEMTPEMIAAVAWMVMAMQSGDDNPDDST
ncbi:hypothetical protein DXG01_014294, partial [Tephrocybe rancida]